MDLMEFLVDLVVVVRTLLEELEILPQLLLHKEILVVQELSLLLVAAVERGLPEVMV
jgi:hypothetical protein